VLADGTQWYFHIRVRDAAGNWAAGAVHSGPYYVDATPPVITDLIINGGAKYTANKTLSLRLSATDPEPGSGPGQMRWKADGGDWSGWREFANDLNISLQGPDGSRTVTVQVRDNAGNVGAQVNATIFLDTVAPRDMVIMINGGANFTNTTTVSLEINASDAEPSTGLAEMSLGADGKTWGGWEIFRTDLDFNLTPDNGLKTVFVRIRDGAGNIGGPSSDSIFLDTVAPVALTLAIANGSAVTTVLSVAVTDRKSVV
jgi:hypothetical protein